MALAYQFPSGYNGFIPNLNTTAQGGLMVEFSRNVESFKLNQYTQLQTVEVEAGKYWRFDQNAMARVNTGDGSQFIWADGADRPAQNMWQGFDMPAYTTTRLNFGFHLGDLATYHAKKAGGVDLVAVNSKMVAGAAMVQRTRKALARLQDTTIMPYVNINTVNWNGTTGWGNFSKPGVIPTGLTQAHYWDQGTAAYGGNAGNPYFRNGVNSILSYIVQQSNGMVQPKDINIIMGPDTAIALGQCNEIQDYVKQSPYALPALLQDSTFGQYGLPSTLYGASKILVEDVSYISSNPLGSNTPTRSWAIPYGTVIFASRPGGIEGSMQSYSTCMGFFLEEMSVEVFDSPIDRYVAGNVVDNYDYQITAPITGFVAQQVISGS